MKNTKEAPLFQRAGLGNTMYQFLYMRSRLSIIRIAFEYTYDINVFFLIIIYRGGGAVG